MHLLLYDVHPAFCLRAWDKRSTYRCLVCVQEGSKHKRGEDSFAKLKRYAAEHGTARVQRSHDFQLYRWCVKQRILQRKGELELVKFRALSSISFFWDLKEKLVRDMFYKLVDFRREDGHCNVPPSTDENLAR